MSAHRRAAVVALTALAPVSWGTTYVVTTELLPPERPLFTALVRALPAGLLLLVFARVLPRGAWWWKAGVLGALNIGAFFPFSSSPRTGCRAGWRRSSARWAHCWCWACRHCCWGGGPHSGTSSPGPSPRSG